LAIPKPAIANAVKTPIAKNGTSALSLPRVTSSSATASKVSVMIPLEKTSRWPRFVSGRGRKRSSATKLANAGKPLNPVLAPVKRIAALEAWTKKYRMFPIKCLPKTARVISESIDGYSFRYGVAWVTWASQATPANKNPRMHAMIVSTRRAFKP